jgi:hypothetical protein
MTNRPLVARLLSPTGFALAGLGLMLPFGAISCQAGAVHLGTLTYSGADLITRTGGHLATSPPISQALTGSSIGPIPPNIGATTLAQAHTNGLRLLLVAAAIAILAGILTATLRPRLARVTIAAIAADTALVMLIGAQIAGRAAVTGWFTTHPEIYSNQPTAGLPAGVSISPGLGFWLSATLLAATAAGNLLGIFRYTRAPTPPATNEPEPVTTQADP